MFWLYSIIAMKLWYSRYTMKQLLIHDFFMPEELIGLRIELKDKEEMVANKDTKVTFVFITFYNIEPACSSCVNIGFNICLAYSSYLI